MMTDAEWSQALPHVWDIDLGDQDMSTAEAMNLFAKYFFGKIRPIPGTEDSPVNPTCIYSVHNRLVARVTAGPSKLAPGQTEPRPERAGFFHIELSNDGAIYKNACSALLPRILKGEPSPV
ncbi:hypothetical protein HS125_03030 [bacterium]|nr:hypothetical protein [bacterium]